MELWLMNLSLVDDRPTARSVTPAPHGLPTSPSRNVLDRVEGFLEAVGVRALGLGQRLEPIRNLVEAFVTRGLRHARVHVGVLVRLARDRSLEVQLRIADRQTGRRITRRLEVFEVAMCVAGLALGGRAEHRRYVVEAFDIGLGCEVEVTAIRLRLACESVLQILSVLLPLSCTESLLGWGRGSFLQILLD